MKKSTLVVLGLLAVVTTGCETKTDTAFTLYRNSPLASGERVHFASFDAAETTDFNRGNCTMAARLLNANVASSAREEGKEPYEGVGFWCESGPYKKEGSVPSSFESAFPASSDGPLSW
ncbi:hypothetical protein [Novosphingobium album (ex Hu et al. 2023)]|uniref:Lipoprotein n=1 Tax=Novosphingobium album (ex Hu et al. 2023) TaxID=2930093 RepID=A0ABT0B3J9_9SPHN|nr:hypothetical protein [Novosphingobium album (ex Hu et al. 2023)]MCJ2179620.1 hypothetical protein [Novosphingobium album (ex Hu et al. 2023)]